MPCDQVCLITSLRIRDDKVLKAVVERVTKQIAGARASSGTGNTIMNVQVASTTVAVNRSANGNLEFRGYGSELRTVEKQVTAAYSDDLLISALRKVDFYLQDTKPMRKEVKAELKQDGVEHTFISSDGRQSVTIGRGIDGRLHFELGGYSKYEAQEVADRIVASMNREGINTDGVTIKQDTEKWLEEKLPDREAE